MPSIFAPYLPAFQLARLQARAGSPGTPSEERGEGAALLVDVAGFTGLTDRFAAHGTKGAEELSDILNTYFGRLTDIIARHGGDVVLFAGDAVLALWPARSGDLAVMTRLAAQCALDLTRELHEFSPSDDVVLRHRAIVGAGAISNFELGGERDRWYPLVAGDAIAQLGPTRKLARPGEVLLSPEAWPFVAPYARAEQLDDGEARLDEMIELLELPGAPPLPDDPHLDRLVRAYVPSLVCQRLEAGHGEWLAEFRPVVVVFIHIAGVAYGTDGTLERLQAAMLAVQKPLQHYEGTVYQLVMDDKGTSLVAAFGLPHHAQEHEAVRALKAAQAAHSTLSGMAVRASIGVASGRAFCGAYGNARRRQYTIVGPVINLASRLTQPAAGGILCDDATHKLAHGRIDFETRPPVLIKGRSELLPVYRPLGTLDDAATITSAFVGRESERRLLHESVDALVAGAGGVIGIIGEAGIGKSYLLREMTGYAELRHARVLRGAGDALERSTSYYVWRDLLPQLCGLHAGADPAQVRAALLARLQAEAALLSWAPLLNAVLPLGIEENDVTRYMESEARIDSMQAIVAHLLEQLAVQPTSLIIDDLHWLDSASLALLLGVALRVPRLLIVYGTRPPDDSAMIGMQRILHWPGGQSIELTPLSSADSTALICQRLGVRTVPPDLAEFIEQRAEGHPFFTDELTLALYETGIIAVANGVCRVVADDLQAANFPDSVQGVVNSRIDRLQPHEQLAVKTASVIGRAFPYDVLDAVYPVEQDRARLPQALTSIERADLAHLESPDPHRSYLFRHVITQETAYNSLLFSHRRRLHENIARWYEQRADGILTGLAPVLAHHWDRAEVADKAIEYLERAGIEALNAFSSHECAQFFQRVQDIAQRSPHLADAHRRAEWERYLGDAYQHMTDYHRSQRHFYEALRLAGRRVPHTTLGRFTQLAREVARQALHRMLPRYFVDSARGARRRDLTNAAVTYRGLTEIAFFQGDNVGMLYYAFCCMNCGERARAYTPMATGAGAVGIIFSVLGMDRLCRFYIGLGTRYAHAGLNLTDIAYVDGIQTTLAEIAAGRWQEAEAACLRGMAGLARVGYRLRWEAQYAGYGFLLQLMGRFDEAMRAFDDVYASARGSRLQNMIFARSGQIGTQLPRGAVPAEWVEELCEMISRSAPMTEVTTSYGLIAQVRLRDGDVTGAWQALASGLELVSRHPPDTYYGLAGFANIAATYLEIWERGLSPVPAAEIGKRARQACSLLRSYSRFMRMGRPRAARCDAWYAALRGRHEQAIKLLYKGLASAQRQQLPHDEALLHGELARRLPGNDARRARHLNEAITRFEQMGAPYDLERARALQVTSCHVAVPA